MRENCVCVTRSREKAGGVSAHLFTPVILGDLGLAQRKQVHPPLFPLRASVPLELFGSWMMLKFKEPWRVRLSSQSTGPRAKGLRFASGRGRHLGGGRPMGASLPSMGRSLPRLSWDDIRKKGNAGAAGFGAFPGKPSHWSGDTAPQWAPRRAPRRAPRPRRHLRRLPIRGHW